ncbi:membrane hypothetical protein [Nitrospina gracilis 3/211]|uniref:Uncharacterized protein n=1 Tax=Nitrospina gracilis (strain 3/211) TaxID=1266370 RepID=M1YZ11_NITG3|nr:MULTISPECIES: hypothetical protein [Nitrospina]MCF8723617.1 hypothetical protein [Nitrospina sp. Nb-3]CCQ90702.1 membrane hypothetical protein [Nitrospina gracilis 3/211]
MADNEPSIQKIDETLTLLKKIWVVFLIALYAACIYNELRFPGFREEPLKGEENLWNIQRVLYFGLLGLGLLTDIVQTRIDRDKAFMYLFASLLLGGLSTLVGATQFKVFNFILG